jgi:predicted DNA-binding transcriptional regulator AlpA
MGGAGGRLGAKRFRPKRACARPTLATMNTDHPLHPGLADLAEVDARDIARAAGMSVAWVYAERRAGRLPAGRTYGRATRWPVLVVRQFLQARAASATPEAAEATRAAGKRASDAAHGRTRQEEWADAWRAA